MNFGNLDVQDLKSAFNKVKAVVLNLTELEQKVREATSNEAWGASSSLMNELSKATYDYQGFNEIMPAIYKRFSQEGRTWRNIYKALTLIEYLIKNGSEKVIDHVRSHSYELKTCLNYNHIDEKGKDQGINIRHRAKLIIELLQNDELIRMERQKANENKAKYGGVGSDGSRYGGFSGGNGFSSGNSYQQDYRMGGSASSGYDNNGGYGHSGGGFQNSNGFSQPNSSGYSGNNGYAGKSTSPVQAKPTIVQQPPPPKPTSVDLLGFDEVPSTLPLPFSGTSHPTKDDEWGDFASATTNSTTQPNLASPFAALNSNSGVLQPVMGSSVTATQPTIGGFGDDEFADFASAPISSATLQQVPFHGGTNHVDLFGPPMTMGSIQSPSVMQPVTSKITATTPLSQLTSSNKLVDLDSLAMLGAKANPYAGPSMNSMIASATLVASGGGPSVSVISGGGPSVSVTSGTGFLTGSTTSSFLDASTSSSSSSAFSPATHQQQQHPPQPFSAFHSGSLL